MSENENDMRKYIPMIDAILEVSDLDSVSIKRIRKALECLYNINLELSKKEIAAVIMERYYHLIDKRDKQKEEEEEEEDDNDEEMQEKRNSQIASDEGLKKELHKKLSTKKRQRGSTEKSKSKKKKKKMTNPNIKKDDEDATKTKRSTGIHAPCVLLGSLKEFMGEPILPRTEIVKRMWDYIKENKLQNENDRREILCDNRLKPIFGDKMTMFSMNKMLSKFIKRQEDIS